MSETKTESQSTEVQPVVMLPVNVNTGVVDYHYIQYDLRPDDVVDSEFWELIEGWEYRKFTIVPVT